jgi:plastocyanin
MRWSFIGAVVTSLCLASSAVLAAEVMVHVGHNSLHPSEISIEAGDAVIFHNMDEMPGGHTIVSEDGALSSRPLKKNETWSHEFTEPGEFELHIKEHPDARMKVTVK